MRYIHAMKGILVAAIIFVLVSVFYSGEGSFDDVSLILTVSTFLFAILAGFFISRLNSRYDKFLELASDEDASFMSLYYMSKNISSDFFEKMTDLIDNYYIICYDFPLEEQYAPTLGYFRQMYDLVESLPREDPYDDMLACLNNIEIFRNKASVAGEDRMTNGQWGILLILGLIIIYSIFYIKNPQPYFQISAILFSTAIIAILLIMRDLQNLMLGGKSAAFESGQENFENIGKLRYYNDYILKNGIAKVPKKVKQYRLGHHNPGEEFDIEIVDNK